MLTLKISKKGTLIWEARYGKNNLADDHACGIGIDFGGNVYRSVGEGAWQARHAGCRSVGMHHGEVRSEWDRGVGARDVFRRATVSRRSSARRWVWAETSWSPGKRENAAGRQVCRMVLRDAKGQWRWTADVERLAGDDGPSEVAFAPQGVCLCGRILKPGADPVFCTFSVQRQRRNDVAGVSRSAAG